MKKSLKFKLTHTDSQTQARAGVIHTPHGDIPTPIFMPVGTHGAIKAQTAAQMLQLNCPILLSNTYHLLLSPGGPLIEKAGGLHRYMGWPKGLLTDSGGFQVFSLDKKTISEEGVTFRPPGGSPLLLTPELATQTQGQLGADIIMAFDECVPYPCDHSYANSALERTTRWLERCLKVHQNPAQALFGIVQGSTHLDLRTKAVKELTKFGLPGYAIGGVSVGEGHELMQKIVRHTAPLLPENKPRYVMGVGTPEDLLTLWENGVDMSDCIIPTKYARGGTLFTNRGKIRISHQRYRRDFYPIEPNCKCYTCQNFSRSYLKHLFDSHELLAPILATTHNIAFYLDLAARARKAIINNSFLDFKETFLENYLKVER